MGALVRTSLVLTYVTWQGGSSLSGASRAGVKLLSC